MAKFMLGFGFGWLGGTIFTILWRAHIDGRMIHKGVIRGDHLDGYQEGSDR